MDDTRLDNLLTTARGRLAAPISGRPFSLPGCLSLARARALTLSRSRWTAEERAHADGCARCAHLLGSFEREMPHLSLWTLLRMSLGVLTEEEERSVHYHLEKGECQHCRVRWARLSERGERALRFAAPVLFPQPDAVGAASAATGSLGVTRKGDLEAEICLDDGDVLLEVRTRNPVLNRHLVGYSCRGRYGRGGKEGFLVFRPDVQGWYVAHARFSPAELHAELYGGCDELLLGPVDVDLLTADERDALLDSAARGRKDARLQAAWAAWVDEAVRKSDGLSEPAWQLVCEIRDQLKDTRGARE